MSGTRIFPILSISCGPTAVCSVTGKPSHEVIGAMADAAVEDGRSKNYHWKDSAFRDQARACEILGFELLDGSGVTVSAKTLPMNPPYAKGALSVPDFVSQNQSPDVLIVVAVDPDSGTSHTFALDGQNFFDCNTEGKIVPADQIPSFLGSYTVTQALAVRKR